MIKHFCFSNHKMTDSAGKCVQSALKFGCDSSQLFQPYNIDMEFYEKNKSILDQDKGAGYWLWKSYFIDRVLKNSNDGDIIVYTDAGVEFVNDVQHLLSEMTHEIMLFGNGHRHGDWCKMDVLKAMNCEKFKDKDQIQASCVIVYNSAESRSFIQEWLGWCERPAFIDDTPSYFTNDKSFKEHRHDQAILTNLAYIYSLPLNRWPAQYGLRGNEKYNNKYPQVFNHHGLRNDGTR